VIAKKALAEHTHSCSYMVDEDDSDLGQSSRRPLSNDLSIGGRQQEKIKIPPSVSKPAWRKRMNVGGKIYEDEFMVLNTRLKQYGYESTIALLRDFKDGIFPEDYFKPQGALDMGQNQSNSRVVSLMNGKPNPVSSSGYKIINKKGDWRKVSIVLSSYIICFTKVYRCSSCSCSLI
jgi:hypothetical protein